MRLFNLSLVKKPQPDGHEPKHPTGRPLRRPPTNAGSCNVATDPRKRTFVVGNGNIDVGNKTPTRKAGQHCRAMSEQCGESGRGSVSASPQKLLHLVGCRDPKIRPEPRVRLPAAPVKR
jgi:hypothetical protein